MNIYLDYLIKQNSYFSFNFYTLKFISKFEYFSNKLTTKKIQFQKVLVSEKLRNKINPEKN